MAVLEYVRFLCEVNLILVSVTRFIQFQAKEFFLETRESRFLVGNSRFFAPIFEKVTTERRQAKIFFLETREETDK